VHAATVMHVRLKEARDVHRLYTYDIDAHLVEAVGLEEATDIFRKCPQRVKGFDVRGARNPTRRRSSFTAMCDLA
jgi:hypothetical protein